MLHILPGYLAVDSDIKLWHVSAGGQTEENVNSSPLSWYRDQSQSQYFSLSLPLSHTLAPVLIKTWQATPKLVKFRNWSGLQHGAPRDISNYFHLCIQSDTKCHHSMSICRALPTCFFLADLPSWHLYARLDSRIAKERSMEMIIITVKTLQNKKAGHLTLLMKHTPPATTPPSR